MEQNIVTQPNSHRFAGSLPYTILMPLAGAVAITLASQVRIDLPGTPVPITGQTFAVLVWGLLFGGRQGFLAAATYLCAGAMGAPVFAGFTSLPALWGPTAGYLLGFLPGAWLAGTVAGSRSASFLRLTAAGLIGHIPILLIGALVMQTFTGWQFTLTMGVVPFLLGDILKSMAAAAVVVGVRKANRGA